MRSFSLVNNCPLFGILVLAMAASQLLAMPEAPTMLTGFAPSASVATLQWQDNSTEETGFEIQLDQDGSGFRSLGITPPNIEAINITRLAFGSTYTFRMAATNADGNSEFSNTFSLVLRNLTLVESAEYTGLAGEAFSQVFSFKDATTEEIFAATSDNLPSGLTIDPSSGMVTGTLEGGQYTGFSVSPADPLYAVEVNIVLDVDAAPKALSEAPGVDVLVGATTEIDLDQFFEDPDVGSTVRFTSAEGVIDVGLFDETSPITVGNFFAYADSEAWDGTFFHRAAKLQNGTPFVNQGGGYRPVGDGTYESIPDLAAIANEFARTRPNGNGTISMAKRGGDPNSATNEWFFSLANNTAILDPQNGGFTVFGKILGDSMTVLSRINDLPRDTYDFTLDGMARSFADWPLRNGATAIDNPDNLVTIESVRRVPSLSYVVTVPTSAQFTAAVSGSRVQIETSSEATGTIPILIEVTDLDGLTHPSTFSVTVVNEPTSFATYVAKFGISDDPLTNNDGDALTTIIEYALDQDPTVISSGLPTITTMSDTPTLSFPLITDLDEIVLAVETSTDAQSWTTVWVSTEGLTPSGNLLDAIPNAAGDVNQLTVSSGISLADSPQQFMRLRVALNR